MSKVEDNQEDSLIHLRNRWQYMKQRLKRRGVVEVGKSHPRNDMLGAMHVAIRKLFEEYPEAKAKVDGELDAAAVDHCIKFNVQSPAGKTYTFESYASEVFACIRSAVDIQDEEFLHSLAPVELPYLEFISNSRSGQDFYFTNNQRFVLKTDKEHCVQYFLSILRDYLNHFQTYPHSLLVKFHGLYSITSSTSKKRYFLVMQSIFYPTIRLDERFDIKGCLANRYQDSLSVMICPTNISDGQRLPPLFHVRTHSELRAALPNPPGRKTILVLKDKNFLEESIEIGGQRDWFLTQLRADVDFLLSIGVLDYSLLLGRHPIKLNEKHESVSNLVLRMKKSFGHDKSSIPKFVADEDAETIAETSLTTVEESASTSPAHVHDEADGSAGNVNTNGIEMKEMTNENNISPSKQSRSSSQTKVSPLKKSSPKKKVGFLRSLSDKKYLDSTGLNFRNRRLLLNCENNLHIIDGSKYRYYVGVIDFFTQFRCRQRVGKWLKDIKTCCGNHSTEPPEVYAERFYQFISERVV